MVLLTTVVAVIQAVHSQNPLAQLWPCESTGSSADSMQRFDLTPVHSDNTFKLVARTPKGSNCLALTCADTAQVCNHNCIVGSGGDCGSTWSGVPRFCETVPGEPPPHPPHIPYLHSFPHIHFHFLDIFTSFVPRTDVCPCV